MRGVDVIIEIEDAKEAGMYIPIAGQRGATLSETSDTLDTTSKDSGGAYEYDYGLYGWTVSCDGLYVKDDAGFEALKQAMRQKTKVFVRVKGEGDEIERGEALVISRELDGAYDAEVTYSVEFQGSGVFTNSINK